MFDLTSLASFVPSDLQASYDAAEDAAARVAIAELEADADFLAWAARPLTDDDMLAMSADEALNLDDVPDLDALAFELHVVNLSLQELLPGLEQNIARAMAG